MIGQVLGWIGVAALGIMTIGIFAMTVLAIAWMIKVIKEW